MQKLELLMTIFEKMLQKKNFWHWISLNRGINIFENFGYLTFFTLLNPNFMQKLEKTNEKYLRYSKTD